MWSKNAINRGQFMTSRACQRLKDKAVERGCKKPRLTKKPLKT